MKLGAFLKSAAKIVLTAGLSVALSKGKKAKPRDLVEAVGRSILTGRVDVLSRSDLRAALVKDLALATGERSFDEGTRDEINRFIDEYAARHKPPFAAGAV